MKGNAMSTGEIDERGENARKARSVRGFVSTGNQRHFALTGVRTPEMPS